MVSQEMLRSLERRGSRGAYFDVHPDRGYVSWLADRLGEIDPDNQAFKEARKMLQPE